MLDRAWRIENEETKKRYEDCMTISSYPHVTWAFHSSSVENLFAITMEGFKLPTSNARQDGWGLLFLGQMIYFAPKLKNGIFYTRDTLGYVILSEIKLGKTLRAAAQMPTMTPERLLQEGFDSIVSNQASSKGTIFAIPSSAQIHPRFLLQFRKLRKTQLLNMAREVALLHRTNFICPNINFVNLSHQRGPYISHGKIHESNMLVAVWDAFPKFGVHCLIIPKIDVLRECLSYKDIKILLEMHTYSQWLMEEYGESAECREKQHMTLTLDTQI